MWISGFDKLMPEGRRAPFKYFPRPGAQLTVTFGDPIAPEVLLKTIQNIPEADPVRIRTHVTTLVHDAVESLGRTVSGNTLGNAIPKDPLE